MVKTTERGGVRGFDGHKRIEGRKRQIRVDTLGLPIADRVEPAGISDRRADARLLAGLGPLFPRIGTLIADAGHESRKLARELLRDNGWKLQIVKRRQRAFKITGLTWIVERTFAWLGRNRRMNKDYEYAVRTGSGRHASEEVRAKILLLASVTTASRTLLPGRWRRSGEHWEESRPWK